MRDSPSFLSVAGAMAILLWGCGGESTASPGTTYQQPSAVICDANASSGNVLLCAIKPSGLDPLTRDIYSSATPSDALLGFGYHALAFPAEGSTVKGVYLHLGGTFGRPYDQDGGTFASATILSEAAEAGYVAIQVAYHNRFLVNGNEECGGHTGIDDCAGEVRYEKITGKDTSPLVDNAYEDGIAYRLKKVALYLQENNVTLPVSLLDENGSLNTSQLRIGGHSQGSGHALYIAKYFGAEHTCMLGGIYDIYDAVPSVPLEQMADWLLDTDATLNLNTLHALVASDDSSFSYFKAAYDQLGMQESIHWKQFYENSYSDAAGNAIDGHGAVVADPAFKALRFEACFK